MNCFRGRTAPTPGTLPMANCAVYGITMAIPTANTIIEINSNVSNTQSPIAVNNTTITLSITLPITSLYRQIYGSVLSSHAIGIIGFISILCIVVLPWNYLQIKCILVVRTSMKSCRVPYYERRVSMYYIISFNN